MYKLNKEELNRSQKGLERYNFYTVDSNGLYYTPDYARYTLELRQDSETILNYVNEIPNYETIENKLMYSTEDIPLILEYMRYIEKLIKISFRITENVFKGRKLKLTSSMTKTDIINITIEQQNRLFDCYNILLKETLLILNIEK